MAAKKDDRAHRLNMSETISTSVSAAAIFSAEDILGGPPKRKDMMTMGWGVKLVELERCQLPISNRY